MTMTRRNFLAALPLLAVPTMLGTTEGPVRNIVKEDVFVPADMTYNATVIAGTAGWYLVSGKIRTDRDGGWEFMFRNASTNVTGRHSAAGYHVATSYQMWAAEGSPVGIAARCDDDMTVLTAQVKAIKIADTRGEKTTSWTLTSGTET